MAYSINKKQRDTYHNVRQKARELNLTWKRAMLDEGIAFLRVRFSQASGPPSDWVKIGGQVADGYATFFINKEGKLANWPAGETNETV